MKRISFATILLGIAAPLAAQVDQQRALTWFAEADSLCRRDGGQLWGISLCGPMVFADRATQTRASNVPVPDAPMPPLVGIVNAPVQWGSERFAAYAWPYIPPDDALARRRLLIHELFHRIQPQLGQYLMQPSNDHLDQLEGRYWLRLEWRALSQGLATTGSEQLGAIGDALGFRAKRRSIFPDMTIREHADEIREGLAQYTGTVLATTSADAAIADARRQLAAAEHQATFVRTFGYPSGTAYGLLLNVFDPGWTRRFSPDNDLGELLAAAAGANVTIDVERAALRYGGDGLHREEVQRDSTQKARVAELQRRYVDGPVVIVPRESGAMLITTGAVPVPGAGTVYREYRLNAEWGTIESTNGLLDATDDATLRVAGPWSVEGNAIRGDGWVITVAEGWVMQDGVRKGDLRIVRRR